MTIDAGFEHILRENEPLAPYTSLKLGGVAEYFAEPTNRGELISLVERFSSEDKPIRLLGGGTNILVRDEGVPGLVIHLASPEFSQMSVNGQTLTAGGGVRLNHFVSTCAREGFSGPEHLVGIPGSIGGALHNNSGSGGNDIGLWVKRVVALTRNCEVVERDRESMSFSYRSSSLNELAILEAEFEFESESPEALTRQMQRNWIVRRSRQPGIDTPAAYAFKDHGGESASELIERAGLKGTRVGNVEIFDGNAAYLVAHPGATSHDVFRLIELIKNQVSDRLEIDLPLALQVW
ncbi:MAG: UDP-N-acetylmuramate dehydrogenase [Pirellulaceae bacterium]